MANRVKRERKVTRQELKEILYRRRYLVPNMVTVCAMCFGFLGIMYSFSDRPNRFDIAPYFILAAIILDGLDGRVARRLNATSDFGGEFDSFSDLIALGVAPAVMMYNWCFKIAADEIGVFIAFVFILCTALRLARFNVSPENLTSFIGIPTPGSAGMVIATVNAVKWSPDNPLFIAGTTQHSLLVVFCSALMLLLSYLMVSNIEFPSIKKMKIRDLGIPAQVPLAALAFLIWYRPRVGWFILAMVYLSSCLFIVLRRRRKEIPVEGQDKDIEVSDS